MIDRTPTAPPRGRDAPSARSDEVSAFLGEARRLAPAGRGRPRLIFALDATLSRQPTWDLAQRVQSEMFAAVDAAGGLDVQLVYFRGFGECRASRWVSRPTDLAGLMTGIDCRGGQTQIARVLGHARAEASRVDVKALVYVGDAMEESADALCAIAGELGLMGVKAFLFQEGADLGAQAAFREIARLTGGAYYPFDARASGQLGRLLQAVAAYAGSGVLGLARLAEGSQEARVLLTTMTARS